MLIVAGYDSAAKVAAANADDLCEALSSILKTLTKACTGRWGLRFARAYTEQSSFNRAFKRWTGQTPRAWLAEKNML